MKKTGIVGMMVLCLVAQGLSTEITVNRLDTYLELPEQETKRLREEFKDKKKLRECFEQGGLLSIRSAEPEKMMKIKQKFGVSDRAMQEVLMDIIHESSAKSGWKSHHDQGGSHDIYVANWFLHAAIIWLGVCADTEAKQFLMGIAADNTTDYYFRSRAIDAYMCRADAQEVQNVFARFLADDAGQTLRLFDIYCAAIRAYDVAKDDTSKREALVAAMSITLAKENNKDTFAYMDKFLAERSKAYADSPQRKAALERLNIPAEKGEQ